MRLNRLAQLAPPFGGSNSGSSVTMGRVRGGMRLNCLLRLAPPFGCSNCGPSGTISLEEWLLLLGCGGLGSPVVLPRVALETALSAYFSTDASIAAIVADRVFFGRVAQRVTVKAPALTFRVISRTPLNSLDGETETVRARVQVNAVGRDGIDAEALMFATRQAVARMPRLLFGVPISAVWIDDGGDELEPPPTGSDSNRTVYHVDVLMDYRERL